MTRIRAYTVPLIILIFGLLIGYIAAQGRPALVNPDGLTAIHLARNLVDGDDLVSRRTHSDGPPVDQAMITKPPFYAVAIAGLIQLEVPPKAAAGWIVLASYALGIVFFYLIAGQALPAPIAAVATVLAAIQGLWLRWTATVHEEMPFVMLTLLALLIAVRLLQKADESRGFPWTILGLVCGAAILTSYQGLPLVLTFGGLVLWHGIRQFRSARPLIYYVLGLLLVGGYPFVRFVALMASGVRPGFYSAPETTWIAMSAAILHRLQVDFLGRMVVWLATPDFLHVSAIVAGYVALFALLVLVARWQRSMLPICLYVGVFLVLLVSKMARIGVTDFEPRVFVPVVNLILLVMVVFAWQLSQTKSRIPRMLSMAGSTAGLLVYVSGQYLAAGEVFADRRAAGSSGDYCHAPETIKWVEANVPAGSVLVSPQCGYQILADLNRHFWLPIPPADEYSASPRYLERWQAEHFVMASKATGARWVVLMRGDPLLQRPGYGDFVGALLSGSASDPRLRLVATLPDGVVYRIES